MRAFVCLAAAGSLLALAACTPRVPDSAAGVGIGGDPFALRPAAGTTINGDPLVPPARVSSEPLPASAGASYSLPLPAAAASGTAIAAAPDAANADIAREAAAALQAAQSNSGVAPVEASPSNPPPPLAGDAGISDENNFTAVAARQTIESDAERLARQRAQYTQVQPTALPQRDGSEDPNIVKYALSTSNPKGARIYSRTGINLAARSARNCAGYVSPELAQIAFLEAGGPQRDRYALDPDGDGYACGWDPSPYRLAVQN